MCSCNKHEKWGKFIDSARFGNLLILLNEDNNDDNHPVWIIARHPDYGRIETSVPFSNRRKARLYLKVLDGIQATRLLEAQLAQAGPHRRSTRC